MAPKLALGSITLGACVLLAGCQQTGGSRFASRGVAQPIMARPNQMPAPNFPTTSPSGPTANAGLRPTSPGSFTPSTPSFPGAANNPFPPANPPGVTPLTTGSGSFPQVQPQVGAPATNVSRPNTVVLTQPADVPALPLPNPPPESSFPALTPPGISPLPPSSP
jgi:hypothetical protein